MHASDGGDPRIGSDGKTRNWSRREFSYPQRADAGASSAARTRLMERIAARVGFESFERVFVVLTGILVLAGCAIVFNAGFMGLHETALIEPTIIIAKQDKPVEPAEHAPAPAVAAAAPVAAAPSPAPAAATPSLLSQTPMRESAREALARVSAPPAVAVKEPAAEAPVAEAAAEPAAPQALGYAEAAPEKEPASARPQDKDAKAEGERVSRCLVKVSGRMLNSGPCKVSHRGQSVTISYGGTDVTIAPHRGREWSLSVGGRNVGKVYKSGACWGSRNHTWVCERA